MTIETTTTTVTADQFAALPVTTFAQRLAMRAAGEVVTAYSTSVEYDTPTGDNDDLWGPVTQSVWISERRSSGCKRTIVEIDCEQLTATVRLTSTAGHTWDTAARVVGRDSLGMLHIAA